MSLPLEGIKVIEFTTMVAAPAACAILSDWGADVIKVEKTGGEDIRHILRINFGRDEDWGPFVGDNRGKKSVVLDVKTDVGMQALQKLIASADVFVSNFRLDALRRLEIDPDTLMNRYPTLICAQITGYGMTGPEKDTPAYDMGAFWARTGLSMNSVTDVGGPRSPSNGVGDRITGMTLAGGIVGALFRREKTGKGGLVETSLMRAGVYANGGLLSYKLSTGRKPKYVEPIEPQANPFMGVYTTADGTFIQLLGILSQSQLAPISNCFNLPEFITDKRFNNPGGRAKNSILVHKILKEKIASKSLNELKSLFKKFDVWYAPFLSVNELLTDEQAMNNGTFATLPNGTMTYNTPVNFFDSSTGKELNTKARGNAPDVGQHTKMELEKVGIHGNDLEMILKNNDKKREFPDLQNPKNKKSKL